MRFDRGDEDWRWDLTAAMPVGALVVLVLPTRALRSTVPSKVREVFSGTKEQLLVWEWSAGKKATIGTCDGRCGGSDCRALPDKLRRVTRVNNVSSLGNLIMHIYASPAPIQYVSVISADEFSADPERKMTKTAQITVPDPELELSSEAGPFEGPEKLLEVWFAPSLDALPDVPESSVRGRLRTRPEGIQRHWRGLRRVPREVWEEMLGIVKCKVLSVIEGEELDAYLLR